MPPAVNVAATATLTVAAACLRTVGKTNEAELLSKKVRSHVTCALSVSVDSNMPCGSASCARLAPMSVFIGRTRHYLANCQHNLMQYTRSCYYCLSNAFCLAIVRCSHTDGICSPPVAALLRNDKHLDAMQEAMKFPLIGSMSLVGLFLAIKFLPKQWLNYIITFYFCLMGTLAIGGMRTILSSCSWVPKRRSGVGAQHRYSWEGCGVLCDETWFVAELLFSTFQKYIPQKLRDTYVVDLKQVTIPLLMPDPEDIRITVARLLTNIAGMGFSLWYAVTRHFLSNNLMGLAYSIEVCSWLLFAHHGACIS